MTSKLLVEKIEENINRHHLFEKGDTILVCVSGGSDSIALLHILLELQERWQTKLIVLHFDHGLRPESSSEQKFVENLAKQYKLRCYSSTSHHLAQEASGVQEKSRRWRLEIAEKFRSETKGKCIATAHHADDQAETLLYKLLRGCHLSNLRGMEWQNHFYIRPLLNCKKSELQTYLKSKSQEWMEDPSNQSSKYLRNRIRLELIPLMNELARGELGKRLDNLSEQSRHLQDWIEQTEENHEISKLFQEEELSIKRLTQIPPMVLSNCLHQYLRFRGIKNLENGHIKKIIQLLQTENKQWQLHLPGKKTIKREGEKLFISLPYSNEPETLLEHPITIISKLGLKIQVQCQILTLSEIPPKEGITLFNIPLKQTLTLRFRKSGDRFQPHWKQRAVKLKDFLRDQKFPLHQRNQIPLVHDENEILAIYPHYLSRSTYSNKNTCPPLHIQIAFPK
ncbi:MAG: tRNA lysidine(34) synthetase TilS [SAR324 cluster bacterium]|nr:tRNA lysidine(34) synthetase TilS [SAR324 cluster bacterium]